MVLPLDPRRAAVIAEAEAWLGTPFEHATMIKGRGVDCIMILAACFSDAGVVPFVDPRPYPRQWFMHHDTERYLIGLMQYGREIEHPEPGDVGVWKFGRCYSHGAILVTPFVDDQNPYRRQGDVIHALQRNGKVERDPLTMGDLLWRPVKWFNPYP
jgi:cell wall-associated NlpC family hydrolase